jgi:hypothetical protein
MWKEVLRRRVAPDPTITTTSANEEKTGLSGMAGNKGAVAIRMDVANTRICFVTAHLAAGFGNYNERNRDYKTISHGLRFQKNRSIDDHDTIIFMGDFNYRIELPDEKVRNLISSGDLIALYRHDQVCTFPIHAKPRQPAILRIKRLAVLD